MNLDTALSVAGFVIQIAIVVLVIYRRFWRTLPLFCVYSIWVPVGGAVAYGVEHWHPSGYFTTYVIEECIDNALQFSILVELAWSIFRPFKASLPRHTVWVIAALIAAVTGAIWPFADSAAFAHLPAQWHLLFHLRQTVSILRIFFFLLLAACSQLLSIGWRDRELQVATGLGFYSLAALSTSILHSHRIAGLPYKRLDQLLVATYIGTLLYWLFSFAQQEAKRREFSPQMQSMLLAVAGAARGTRHALSESGAPDRTKPRDR